MIHLKEKNIQSGEKKRFGGKEWEMFPLKYYLIFTILSFVPFMLDE